MEETAPLPHEPTMPIFPPTPAGLEALYSLCRKIYPDQPNPLQVTALLKYWLSGPDPLDYISMYANSGNEQENIPPHWHYISFGLSDLHGDGRVHEVSESGEVSGYGFELTFRLKKQPKETAPPTWPATLMQSLAKYVFQSGNTLCPGDHVSWHCALDNSDSRIRHMLMANDSQLNTAFTPFGTVNFVQIVGVCTEELRAAQQWNGDGVLKMLARLPTTGGLYLVTDLRRGESIFELQPSAHEEIERGFEQDGSNLSGVSARCLWLPRDLTNVDISYFSEQILTKASLNPYAQNFEDICKMEMQHDSLSRSGELTNIKRPEAVHLVLNLEAGSLLPLAIRGRVKHGRHFTFKSVLGESAITLVADSVTGTLVNDECLFAARGNWLQVLISDLLAQDMASKFQILTTPEALVLPKTFVWPEIKLSITIVADKL